MVNPGGHVIELAGFILVFGLLVAVALNLWEPDETVQDLLDDDSLAFATALNVSTVPPFYTVQRHR